LAWFAKEGRTFPWRNISAPRYSKIVSEILLQRTRAQVAGRFLPTFLRRFPSWSALSAATERDLQSLLEPLGLWRRRAATLVALAKEMDSRRGRFPRLRSELEELPGIGQYVASAVLLFCHGKREPLLDVNMARVLERFFGPRTLVDIRYDPWLQDISRQVVDHERAVDINWAILDFAAAVCIRARPRCSECLLATACTFYKESPTAKEQADKKTSIKRTIVQRAALKHRPRARR